MLGGARGGQPISYITGAEHNIYTYINICLLYISDAADEEDSVELVCSSVIKKKKR